MFFLFHFTQTRHEFRCMCLRVFWMWSGTNSIPLKSHSISNDAQHTIMAISLFIVFLSKQISGWFPANYKPMDKYETVMNGINANNFIQDRQRQAERERERVRESHKSAHTLCKEVNSGAPYKRDNFIELLKKNEIRKMTAWLILCMHHSRDQ